MDKDTLLLHLNEKWKCDLEFGWIPITSDNTIPNTEIYQSDYLSYYIEEIKAIIRTSYGVDVLFEIKEDGQFKELDINECDFCYDGLEYIYTHKDLRFVLYFSHENSTTIGGELLLEELHRTWPEYRAHLWKSIWS
jgi:hypothetical protein